jgi:hypothetical protein
LSGVDAAPDATLMTRGDAGPSCGDGIVNGTEECDLAQLNNTAVYGDHDGCTPACTRPHYCGDGIVDPAYGEMCDFGDLNGSSTCGIFCIVFMP